MKPLIEYLREEGLADIPFDHTDEACRIVANAVRRGLEEGRPAILELGIRKAEKDLGESLQEGRGVYWGSITKDKMNPYLRRPADFHRSTLNEEIRKIIREKEGEKEDGFELKYNIPQGGKGTWARISAVYYQDYGKMTEFLTSHLTSVPLVVYTFGVDPQ